MNAPQPQAGTPARKPIATISGVGSLLGRFVAAGVVAGTGFGGWLAVDHFDVDLPYTRNSSLTAEAANTLPALGDGLPQSRLGVPEPWRQFEVTYQEGEKVERFAFDLDTWKLTVSSAGDPPGDEIEIHGDVGFVRRADSEVWEEQSINDTRNIASFLMAGIGPFVLTDLVPPDVVGFTTLELEGTSRGERVYEVSVDAPTLQAEHPLSYQRWVTMTRVFDGSSEVYRIRVRPDGYIVRIDGVGRSVQWDTLPAGVEFLSPIAASLPVGTVPAVVDPAAEPAVDGAPVPAPEAPVDSVVATD